mgnify:FL=1|jgi:hypothetical protein
MKTIQIQKRRRKTMNKKEVEGTEIQRSYIPKLIGMGFTRKEVSEITGLGHQLISDYYIKYKNKYEK